MSGSGGNVGAQAGDSNPDMNRTTSAENNAKEDPTAGKVSRRLWVRSSCALKVCAQGVRSRRALEACAQGVRSRLNLGMQDK